jgi:hypothetical protein
MMTFLPRRATAAIGAALAVLAFGATAAGAKQHTTTAQKLVVRGDDTVVDAPCPAGLCLKLQGGTFRGAPVGTGAYTGDGEVRVAEAFPNGEGGICAPFRGSLTLGAGTADRLVIGFRGDSCQDGAGNPATTAFTGLARFHVKYGTGKYAHARGGGVATFLEGADDHERITLIGRIKS